MHGHSPPSQKQPPSTQITSFFSFALSPKLSFCVSFCCPWASILQDDLQHISSVFHQPFSLCTDVIPHINQILMCSISMLSGIISDNTEIERHCSPKIISLTSVWFKPVNHRIHDPFYVKSLLNQMVVGGKVGGKDDRSVEGTTNMYEWTRLLVINNSLPILWQGRCRIKWAEEECDEEPMGQRGFGWRRLEDGGRADKTTENRVRESVKEKNGWRMSG